LIESNRNRSKREGEFELINTGIFDENKYFDVFVEYAKAENKGGNAGSDEACLSSLPAFPPFEKKRGIASLNYY
jgi:hypothetical protein